MDGLFKKRSASLTPDLKLNHVGFLGAAAPAVKGLKDVEFTEDSEYSTIEFNEVLLEIDQELAASKVEAPLSSPPDAPSSDSKLIEQISWVLSLDLGL